MGDKVSDFLLKRLSQWGIKRIFDYPDDGINGILGGLERHQDLFEFVQVRHEEMTAFMATAHAKFTDEVGVCLATSGPGAIHMLNGLYDAKMDHRPVVAIVGQAATTAIGGNYQQEVDLTSLFKDVAGEYVFMASSPVQIRHLVDRAMRIATAERSVTCIIIPKDVQEKDAVEQPPHTANTLHTGLGYSTPRVVPTEADLKHAADILNAGKKVAMLIGIGAKHAADEVVQVADLLGCGVAKALLGKQVLPDDLPFGTGCLGLPGTKPSYDMMMGCDSIINISSVHEAIPMPQNVPYCCAKGGMRMLTRTICLELAPHNITVNNIAPGAVHTPIDADVEADPEKMAALLKEIPLHRMAQPEEIARLALYLASDAAAYITGSTYIIDGGLSVNTGAL
jgi:pyruvate dehydrogenase (quinone)